MLTMTPIHLRILNRTGVEAANLADQTEVNRAVARDMIDEMLAAGYDSAGDWHDAECERLRVNCSQRGRFLACYMAVIAVITAGFWLVLHYAPQIDAWGGK